eukprot:s1041_g4.t1
MLDPQMLNGQGPGEEPFHLRAAAFFSAATGLEAGPLIHHVKLCWTGGTFKPLHPKDKGTRVKSWSVLVQSPAEQQMLFNAAGKMLLDTTRVAARPLSPAEPNNFAAHFTADAERVHRLSPARSSARGCLCFSGAVRAANSKGRAFWALAQASCAAEFHSVDTMDIFISGGCMALNQMIWPLPLQEPPVLLGGWSLGARPARQEGIARLQAYCR